MFSWYKYIFILTDNNKYNISLIKILLKLVLLLLLFYYYFMYFTVEIVKRKWKLIRCNYRKKLTRIPLKNIDKYPNARLLEFLLPMMKFDASVEK